MDAMTAAATGFDVPLIDISPYTRNGDPADRAVVAARFDDAASSVGFIQVVGHEIPAAVIDEFTAAMDEDLNLAGAMAVVHATLKALNVALTQAAPSGGQGADDDLRASVTGLALDLRSQLDVLGLDPLAEPWRTRVLDGAGSSQGGAAMEALDRLIRHDLEERAQARVAKDWARADALRDKLTEAGVVVEDSPTGAASARGNGIHVVQIGATKHFPADPGLVVVPDLASITPHR